MQAKEIESENHDEKTYLLGNAKIHIEREDDPESPREWSTAWKWYSNHRRYFFDKENGNYLSINDIFDGDTEDGESIKDAILRQNPEFLDVRPIYLHDHSGISISLGSFNDPWDSGVGAYAVITREQAEADAPELKGDDNKLIEAAYGWLEGEVESYQAYLDGDVYGYVVENGSGNEIGSCWGYYSIDDCLADAAACVSVKDRTIRNLDGLEIINMMNEKQGVHFDKISWTDMSKDGEKLYTTSVSLGAECTETYWNPDALARQLGYQRGEFNGHLLTVWNETENDER